MSCRVQLLPHSLLALTAIGRMRAKHPSKSRDRNAEGNLDHCLMIVYIHCQYPSSVTGCEADIVQQLIPRDKKETESRFGLQLKIVTAKMEASYWSRAQNQALSLVKSTLEQKFQALTLILK